MPIQSRYLIDTPEAFELRAQLSEAINTGELVPVLARPIGSFALMIVNGNVRSMPTIDDVSGKQEEILLAPSSSLQAASNDNDGRRTVVNVFEGIVVAEPPCNSFTLTITTAPATPSTDPVYSGLPVELVVTKN